jgi:hypothetical protein
MPIITTHYRYKRPPRKRKAVALEAPSIVRKFAARAAKSADDVDPATLPASDDRKSAIVTTTSRKRLELLRAEKRTVNPDGDPEMRTWLLRAMQGRWPRDDSSAG